MAQKSLTFSKYRLVDSILFAVILAVIEALLASLSQKFINVNFSFSVTYLILSIVLMRWGYVAVFHSILAGIIYCAFSGGGIYQYVGFSLGNCFSLISLLFLKLVGKKRVSQSFLLSSLFVIIVYLLITLGRSILLSILNKVAFFDILTAVFAVDLFSLVITLVIILAIRRQEGLFEDQKEYLLRTEEERMKQRQNSAYDEDDLTNL